MCPQLISDYQARMQVANEAAARLRAAKLAMATDQSAAARAQVERSIRYYADTKRAAEQAEEAVKRQGCSYTKIAFVPV